MADGEGTSPGDKPSALASLPPDYMLPTHPGQLQCVVNDFLVRQGVQGIDEMLDKGAR